MAIKIPGRVITTGAIPSWSCYGAPMICVLVPDDGHHEMSDPGADSELGHGSGKSVGPVYSHQRRMIRAGLMEKIMSKTNDTSRELPENELDAVSGGVFRITNVRVDASTVTPTPNVPTPIQASIS